MLTAALSCGLVTVLVVGALSLDAGGVRFLFLAVLALVALGTCFALPVESLPTAALVLVVLVPDRVADYSVSPVLTPATVVLIVWVVRRLLARDLSGPAAVAPQDDRRLHRRLTTVCVLLALGMIPLVLVSPSKRFSVAWAVTFALAVVAPLLVRDFEEEARRLRRALPLLGSLVALYAVVQYLVQRNVVYTPLYEALGLDDLQHWAVYRSDASLGHPLVAGLFFASVLAFCVGRWAETGRRSFTLAALMNALGIVTTVSRGSYVAGAVAVSVVLLLALGAQRRHRVRQVLVLAVFAGAGILAVNTDAFVERGLSAEGQSSLSSRNALPQIAVDTARAHHWLGGGPATSLPLAAPFNFQHLPIENSYLQLLIGLGLWGLILFTLILVLAAAIAVRRRNLSGLGALVGYATAIAGFAALDSRRDLVVLLGLLVMVSLYPPDRGRPVPTPPADLAVVLPRRSAGPALRARCSTPARRALHGGRDHHGWTPGQERQPLEEESGGAAVLVEASARG